VYRIVTCVDGETVSMQYLAGVLRHLQLDFYFVITNMAQNSKLSGLPDSRLRQKTV
jgi:hypothetical protein